MPEYLSKKAKKNAQPLRKILWLIAHSSNIYQPDFVHLECGHEVHAWGQYRARCWRCQQEAETVCGEPK